MCGIAGFIQSSSSRSEDSAKLVIQRMTAAITHRGPDSLGFWSEEGPGVVLGHQRLSILDLSSAGHQPMQSACGRYILSFNGEIYNHLELRAQLKLEALAPAWRGHADTETLLSAFAAWGVEPTLQAARGMFAISLWDTHLRILTIARDRMGEKPLYYGWQGDIFLFGSELKALKQHPAFQGVIDRNSLTLLLRHNCIPAPFSIYRGIKKLKPGEYLNIPAGNFDAAKIAEPKSYWNFNDAVEKAVSEPFSGTTEQALNALDSQLSKSISEQMLADVPLGAFLSGGVDSSTVVALMQAQTHQPVSTFTIGFDEGEYNEAEAARNVARHLGTNHTELYVQPSDALNVIPHLHSVYCEPFGDSSQIPTFLVSQMAGQHVTVALSGDGGDELFGGYNRYLGARNVWSKMQRLPRSSRQFVASILRALPPATWDSGFNLAKPLLPRRFEIATPGDKAHKLADVLSLTDSHSFFRQLTSHWKDPGSVVKDSQEPETLLTNSNAWPDADSFEHWMMAMDSQTYLPDDILVKVDRAAMACSLETRVPMLDHRVIELAWKMPLDLKIRNGQGKWLLRQVLYRYVPASLIERPKMGFGIPLGSWLRGPLRAWAAELLNESRLNREGYFHSEPILAMWKEHLSGRKNWQHHLWVILMFQSWLENEHETHW